WGLCQFWGPYHEAWSKPNPSWEGHKSIETYRAEQILGPTASKRGPGWIFTNFHADLFDQSLFLATYPFNACANPTLLDVKPSWFALVTVADYAPFLNRQWKGGQWTPLSQGLDRPGGGLALGVFPFPPDKETELRRWIQVSRLFQNLSYCFLNRATGTSYGGILSQLETIRPSVQGDPFLESCFAEKRFYLLLQNSMYGDRDRTSNFLAARATV